MRLLTWDAANEIILTSDLSEYDGIPPYAILSHTWGPDNEEVTFGDIEEHQGRGKDGYKKIRFCGDQARKDGYKHFWVDTCCINKDSLSELSEAIISMYKWYKNAAKCYVYLSDVSVEKDVGYGDAIPSWQSQFRKSQWFTRGWTLQELLAPSVVEFYSQEQELLGTKTTMVQQIHEITTIPIDALQGRSPLHFTIAERLRWAEHRHTKKREDKAYCLLGIFDVYLPLIYGEGDNALRRLWKEVGKQPGGDTKSADTETGAVRVLGLCLSSAPCIRPGDFVGRHAELEAMTNIFQPGDKSTEQRRIVLGGMGGIGKTQLALAYTREHKDHYTSVIWLNATTESTLHSSIRSLSRGLVTIEDLERLSNQQVSDRFLAWLSDPQNMQWLLIFDNYDEPDSFDIDTFFPNIGHGSLIITTRLPDQVLGHHIRVQPLRDINHSLKILEIRSGRSYVSSDSGALELAQRCDGLPLALVTAGAYLRKSTITFQEYLDTYEQRWRVAPTQQNRLPEYGNRTLFTTWDLSYARLKDNDPDAAQILPLLAYFDNQNLWYELISAGKREKIPAALRRVISHRSEFENAMATLVDYCFIEVQPATQSYSMHNCTHNWISTRLNENLVRLSYWYAFDCIVSDIGASSWETLNKVKYGCRAAHAIHLVRLASIHTSLLADLDRIQFCHLFSIIGFLIHQSRLGTAEQMVNLTLAIYETKYARSHAVVIESIHFLAHIRKKAGKYDEAAQIYRTVLALYEENYGTEHSAALSVMRNLGLMEEFRGRLGQAKLLYTRALTKFETVLGASHTECLAMIISLGDIYTAQGELKDAEKMYLQALTIKENVLGLKHCSTLETVSDLGLLYSIHGNTELAKKMCERTLQGYTEIIEEESCTLYDIWVYMQCISRYIRTFRTDKRLDLPQLCALIKWWDYDQGLLYGLAKVLICVDDERKARAAFQYAVECRSDQAADRLWTRCDGCGLHIVAAKGFYRCRTCVETDLCDKCMDGVAMGRTLH